MVGILIILWWHSGVGNGDIQDFVIAIFRFS